MQSSLGCIFLHETCVLLQFLRTNNKLPVDKEAQIHSIFPDFTIVSASAQERYRALTKSSAEIKRLQKF